mmetsp:Transcript_20982/g.35198  ORF Transcript_20982/g.35198 Transcript_20982/m.35198 type:complete len:248 (+) Transcript_20982:930-1673(+)
MDPLHGQVILRYNRLALGQQLVPDPKTRRGPSDVRLGVSARPHARVKPQPDLRPGALHPVPLQLIQRTGVDLHAFGNQLGEKRRQLLRAQGHVRCGDPSLHGPDAFVPGACINVEALLVEDLQDGRVGGRLHGVAHGQAERVGECEGLVCLAFECGPVVYVGRGADILCDFLCHSRGEEVELLHGYGRRLHRRIGERCAWRQTRCAVLHPADAAGTVSGDKPAGSGKERARRSRCLRSRRRVNRQAR